MARDLISETCILRLLTQVEVGHPRIKIFGHADSCLVQKMEQIDFAEDAVYEGNKPFKPLWQFSVRFCLVIAILTNNFVTLYQNLPLCFSQTLSSTSNIITNQFLLY